MSGKKMVSHNSSFLKLFSVQPLISGLGGNFFAEWITTVSTCTSIHGTYFSLKTLEQLLPVLVFQTRQDMNF